MSRFSAVFAGFLALFVYLAIFPYLIGFDFHFWQQTKVLGVVWCILFLPFLIKKDNKGQNWWLTPSLQTIFLLFLLGAIGYVCRWWVWLSGFAWLLAVVGVALFIWNVIFFWKQTNWKQKLIFLGLSFVFGNYFVAQIYGKAIFSPIYEANVAFYRGGIPDILDVSYHSSITAMLQTYNTMTTGLDGLVAMNYNILVHFLFAQLGLFFSVPILDFFNLSYPLLIFPLFFYTFLSLSDCLYKQIAVYLQKPPGYVLFHLGSIILLVCLLFPIPDNIYSRGLLGLHFTQVAIYTTALAFFFAFVEVCLHYFRILKQRLIFEWFFLPASLFILGYSHVSAGVTMLAGIGYGWLVSQKWKSILGWLWAILHVFILFFCYWLTAETKVGGEAYSHEGRLNWFFFFKQDGFNGLEFAWGMYLPLALTVFLLFRRLKTRFSISPDNTFLHYALGLCFIALAGILPNIVLELYGSTGMYFLSVQRFLAGSLLMVMLAFVHFSLPYKQVFKMSAVFGIILLMYMPFRNTLNDAWQKNMEVRKEITGIKDFHWKANHFVEKMFSNDAEWAKVAILFDKNLEQKAMRNDFFAFTRKLKNLDKTITVPEKAKSLLFIPYNTLKFSHFKEKQSCKQVPMYFTAISGMALLKGLPDAKCTENLGDYGYSYYNYEGREKAWQNGYKLEEALQITKQKGFQFLWYYNKDNQTFEKKY